VGAIVILLLGRQAITSLFKGPREIGGEDIASLGFWEEMAFQDDWVKIRADGSEFAANAFTGQDEFEKTVNYYLLKTRAGTLVVSSKGDHAPTMPVAGVLKDPDANVRQLMGKGVLVKGSERLVPWMLDEGDESLLGVFVLLAMVPAMIAAWNLWKGVRRMLDPGKHPAMRVLARSGPAEEIAVAVDAEHQAGGEKIGRIEMTRSWLIERGVLKVRFFYLGDVVWIYKYVLQGRLKHCFMTMHDRHGKLVRLKLKEAKVDELLGRVREVVPWALSGYDKEWAAQWKKNQAAFVATVEERRKAYMAGQG
jgi:hypothetical protein